MCACKCPSDAALNQQVKKTESIPETSKLTRKKSKADVIDSHGMKLRTRSRKRQMKKQDWFNKKDFVTIDVGSFRLTPIERQKRTELMKSKNQVLGELEAYNQTFPVQSRISPEITQKLLKERVMSKTNIFEFDNAMTRADKILEESRGLLPSVLGRKTACTKFTDARTAPRTELSTTKAKQSKSVGSLPDKYEENLALLLKRKLMANQGNTHPLRYDQDGSVLVPESQQEIFPLLAQEQLAKLGNYQISKNDLTNVKPRKAVRFHRGTLSSPKHSEISLGPGPLSTESTTFHLPDDIDKLLLLTTREDMKQLALYEDYLINYPEIQGNPPINSEMENYRSNVLNHIKVTRDLLHKLRSRDLKHDSVRVIEVDEELDSTIIPRTYIKAKVDQTNIRYDISHLLPPSLTLEIEEAPSDEEEGPRMTESEELYLNLSNAKENRLNLMPTRKRRDRQSFDTKVRTLKNLNPYEFPRDSDNDLDQRVSPLAALEWERPRTTSYKVSPDSPAPKEKTEEEVKITMSEHSFTRYMVEERLNHIGNS